MLKNVRKLCDGFALFVLKLEILRIFKLEFLKEIKIWNFDENFKNFTL